MHVLIPRAKPVHINLIAKYDCESCFFFAKPINEIIYNETKATSTIDTKDAIYFADDSENLRRVYYYHNALGKKEIEDRIELLADFYSKVRSVTTELPLMFLTNTKKIFKTRLRRLRKMKASDGSSDESEVESSHRVEFSTNGFLKSLNKSNQNSQSSNSKCIESIFRSLREDDSYDDSVHDIYADNGLQIEMQDQVEAEQDRTLEAALNQREETGIGHLICDFYDVDAEKTVQDYERLLKISQSTSSGQRYFPNLSSNNNENRKPYRNKILNNYHHIGQRWGNNEQNKLSSISGMLERRNRLASQMHPHGRYNGTAAVIQRPYMQMSRWAHLEDQQGEDQCNQRRTVDELFRESSYYKGLYGQNEEVRQNATKNSKKQRIRDKAAELLSRVKSQDYIQQTQPDSTDRV